MIEFVRDGDTVLVHPMERLARNLDDLMPFAITSASALATFDDALAGAARLAGVVVVD